ncbi:MAG: imidazolonepropionase [Betaproteobacteria bacterium]|nr:MAG: imidazolonepropionase [Betaproteobacteria bacterium]
MSEHCVWQNLRVATLAPRENDAWGIVEDAVIVTKGDHIAWLGERSALPLEFAHADRTVDLKGALVTPPLIDCHTHLVYAGNRAHEFELRLEGASYEAISRAGGGIRSTVAATRAASEDELFALACERARALMREGIATLEIKSGYGLSLSHERQSLRVARRVGEALGIEVKTTYLAAHALPEEFAGRSDEYVAALCEWMRELHDENLIDAVDVFCERIGFSREQTRTVFEHAKALGLPVKLHAEQLSDQGGAALASEFGALSCDHLEYVSDDGIAAMARAGVVAVVLPGAYYFLRETQLPPIEKLRASGVPIALATDHNPGSSPTLSPLLMMNMACTLFRMTPIEAWLGFTVNAALALGLPAARGRLEAGAKADFVAWNASHPRDLVYRFGHSPLHQLVLKGQAHEALDV